MHLFEFLLRDLMNTEAASRPEGVIALHDCIPFNERMTQRDNPADRTGAWTGDVWKLLPILAEYRPDLKVEVLDCKPTGLVLVSNLNPRSKVLFEAYDEIVARYTQTTLADFGTDRFTQSFAFTDARVFAAAGFPTFAKIRLDDSQALTLEKVSP